MRGATNTAPGTYCNVYDCNGKSAAEITAFILSQPGKVLYITWYHFGVPYTWVSCMLEVDRWGYNPPANGFVINSGVYAIAIYFGDLVAGKLNVYRATDNAEYQLYLDWNDAKIYY